MCKYKRNLGEVSKKKGKRKKGLKQRGNGILTVLKGWENCELYVYISRSERG